MKTVKQVAKLTGASVRTLQYYDQTQLLEPSTRSAAGYRLYSDDDIAKLRRILLLRELGFSLKEIQALVHDSSTDQTAAFRRQKALLIGERTHTDKVIDILARLENGASLDDCAEELQAISAEQKSQKSARRLLLLLCPLILAVSLITLYQILQPDSASPVSENDAPIEPALPEDIIHLNTESIAHSTACWYIDIRDFDPELLPESAPTPSQIVLPASLQEHLKTQAIYGVDVDSGAMTNFVNYVFSAKNPDNPSQYVYIGFAADREPIRELYTPLGETSIISGHEMLISFHLETNLDGESTVIYIADFSTDAYTFNVEAHGLDESEFITLLKSLL